MYTATITSLVMMFFAIWLNAKYGIKKVENLVKISLVFFAFLPMFYYAVHDAPGGSTWLVIGYAIGLGVCAWFIPTRKTYEETLMFFGYKTNPLDLLKNTGGYYLYLLINVLTIGFLCGMAVPMVLGGVIAGDERAFFW